MVGCFVDEAHLVTLAMNGWGAAEPAWWPNLQANPNALVVTRDWRGRMLARAATGDERDRLWAQWSEIDTGLEGFLRCGPVRPPWSFSCRSRKRKPDSPGCSWTATPG